MTTSQYYHSVPSLHTNHCQQLCQHGRHFICRSMVKEYERMDTFALKLTNMAVELCSLSLAQPRDVVTLKTIS